MGFFSWQCKGCDHPLLSSYATNDINDWMRKVVVIEEGGSILQGDYDGYGRVDERDINWSYATPCVWHQACWEKADCPVSYDPSDRAEDQGFFFEDGDHDLDCPGDQL